MGLCSLGDWVALDAVTVAEVQDGDERLEDLGIELEPGTTVVVCRDAVAAKVARPDAGTTWRAEFEPRRPT